MSPKDPEASTARLSRLWKARFAFLGFFAFFLLLGLFLRSAGHYESWLKMHGVWPEDAIFLDLRQIEAGVLAREEGLDPFVYNPYDSLKRRFNYPSVWLSLPFFGRQSWAVPFYGFLFLAAYACGTMLLVRRGTMTEVFLLAAATLSPAVVLGLDRANSDLFVFALVVAWILLAANPRRRGRAWIGAGVGLTACVLKLFPIAAVSAWLPSLKQRVVPWQAFAVVCGALGYLFLIREELSAIRQATPDAVWLAYGYRVLPNFFYALELNLIDLFTLEWVLFGVAVGLALLGFRVGFRRGGRSAVFRSPPEQLLFGAGAGIYGFTFMLGGNFNYRLVFLLLTLPLLLRAVEMGGRPRLLAAITLGCIFLMLWGSQVYFSLSLFLTYPVSLALLGLLAGWMGAGLAHGLAHESLESSSAE